MKVSFNWLRELVELKPGVTADSVAQQLTLVGLEVESIERRGRDVGGVLVAEVRGTRPHPSAEKLTLVRVVAGGTEEEVVCGARNVPAAGGKVAWAPPGSTLPGGRKLERKDVRGVSSPGMLCSEVELGISDAGDGILILSPEAPAGADLVRHIGLLDEVLEVNVTPNRPDALSHAGIAREVAALFGAPWRMPAPDSVSEIALPVGRGVDVQIRDAAGCPRYNARIVTGLSVGASPLALRVRLAACGMRAISNLVDVTNYVMLETGHPLHAFDLAKLKGDIQVRRANRGERMTTLDGVDRALQEGDVVIADDRGAIALAGVMGGADSEISTTTTAVLLETATFDPRAIRRTARRLGLHSEASHRFERGVDAEGIPHASRRAATMMARAGGGALAGEGIDRYPQQQEVRRVSLSFAGLSRLAGFEIPLAQAAEKLTAIGIASVPDGSDRLTATIPSFRPDISIEQDLVEEVMRLVGYDRAPARLPRSSGAPAPSPQTFADRARDLLAALGLAEIVSWGFVPRGWLAPLGGSAGRLAEGVVVKNPISSDYEVMRTSLLPALLDAARRNVSRGVADVGLFEVGPVVWRALDTKEAPDESLVAAAILVGRGRDWLKPGPAVDFFDGKHIAVEVLRGMGVASLRFQPVRDGLLHPGAGAAIYIEGRTAPVGQVGEVHPRIARALGLEQRAVYFEVMVDALAGGRLPIHSVPPPRFPAVTRDISFWSDVAVTADEQRALLASAAGPLLRELSVLEDYRDPRYAPAGKKGMLWSLTYRADDRTLTDAEVDAAHARIVTALKSAPSIVIR
jgi:phenylalanyl-tRNA synthetase beta chain